MKDDLTKWMNRFQSVGIDKDLLHIRSIGSQGIDQLMGGGTVEITVEGEVDTIPVFMLENLEVQGHRLAFLSTAAGGTIRLSEKDSSNERRLRHTGSGEAAGSSTQAIIFSDPQPSTAQFPLAHQSFSACRLTQILSAMMVPS